MSEVDAQAAAVFTRNHFPGAPIVLGRETIRGGVLRAIVANSKCSNVATGPKGIEDARRMARAAAAEVQCAAEHVLVSSTGVIGVPLPIEKIEQGIVGMMADLEDDPLVGARGIMTTDSYPKALSLPIPGSDATLSWVAKGSGMIAPNMATMLCYIFTDAQLDAPTLDKYLREAVKDTLGMLSVDTDTSTSDTCVIMANGLAGAVDASAFRDVLRFGCTLMTELLARDGEGATRLLRVHVSEALNDHEARVVARTVNDSPLIKTMVHGADPNVGRLLMAVGKCFDCTVRPETTHAWINGHHVVGEGSRLAFDDQVVRNALTTNVVDLRISLGVGLASATAYGCDLTAGYVEENAAYYSS